MGRWQHIYLNRITAENTSSRANTITVDLPQKDFLSQIMVRFYQLNLAYTYILMPVFHTITKLEVVDGADVIYSLSGAQSQAISYYRGRTNPCTERVDWAETETSDCFFIRFGRYAGDTKYILDLGKLTNPQLKITYDTNTTVRDGFTYTVPTTPTTKYTVCCMVLRGAPANYSGKYISAREIFTYTADTSSTEYVNIPRTEQIFAIGVRAAYTATDMANELSRVRLNINNQEWIPFDIYWKEMVQLHEEWFVPKPIIEERILTYNDIRIDSGLGHCESYQMENKWYGRVTERIQSNTGGWFRVRLFDTGTQANYTTATPILYFATGLFPHHMIYLPMDKIEDGDIDYLDAPATSKIQLEVTANSSAGGSCVPSVVLDVLRSN